MKNRHLLSFLLFAISFCWGTIHAQASTLSAPEQLRCEYLVNPTGIDETAPRLEWINQAADKNARGLSQSAYQVLVASSREALDRNEGDLWNSGKVASSKSLQIAYQGKPLQSHQACFWKVRVWDQDGSASDWSAVASWSMGLLGQDEWTAEWIGRDDGKPFETANSITKAQWIWSDELDIFSAPAEDRFFIRTLVIPKAKKISHATVSMTADNRFTLLVNGKSVLYGDKFNIVYKADITQHLVSGKNILVVEARNDDVGPAALIGTINIDYIDGSSMSIITDASWQVFDRFLDTKHFARVVANYGEGPWGKIDKSAVYLPASYLRKDFTLKNAPKRAVLYVTALGHVEPHLNGKKVGNEFLTPGWTNYRKRLYYRTFDVTDQLQAGKNTLGAILGDGWFRGQLSIIGQNHYGKKTRLRAQLHIFNADGSMEIIKSDNTWKAGFGPILESDMQAGETYDARLEIPGWSSPDFDDSQWHTADTGAEINPEKIEAYPGAPIRVIGELPPPKITQPKKGLQVFDMGVNFSGWVRLRIDAPKGTKIVMRFGEMLNPDGTVYRINLRSARATDTYICKGGGEEIWEPTFTYHGFQYVEVEGLPYATKPDTLTPIVVYSDLPLTGKFASSSDIATRTANNMRWSIRANSFEIPTDCPQRDERMGWMDYHEVARSAQYELNQSALFTKWVTDMMDARLADGVFSQTAPDVHGMNWTPGWADGSVFIPWTMYLVYDDTRLCGKWFDEIAAHVKNYEKISPDFIAPEYYYGDWLAFDQTTPSNLISTALFARCAFVMGKMSEALGKTEDAKRFNDLFGKIRIAFQKKFVHADGSIGSNSQASYVFPLAFDLLDEKQREIAGEKLVAAIRAKGNHLSTGMVTTHLLLPTLTKIGRSDVAYELVEQTTLPSWGFFLEKGATSIWERWDSKTDKEHPDAMNSYNHANLGTCTEWFYRSVLGIDLLEPGFKKILIRPQPDARMTWAKGSYNSPYGHIATDWIVNNDSFTLAVTIPPNTEAEVYIPGNDSKKIYENGISVEKNKDIKILRQETDATVLRIGSGNYRFERK